MAHRNRAEAPRMQRGITFSSPIPTQIVSNGEFIPPTQTPAQVRVERLIDETGELVGRRLGVSRRDFLKTTGGMAAALLAMNSVFGRFFDVLGLELVEAAAFDARNFVALHQSTLRKVDAGNPVIGHYDEFSQLKASPLPPPRSRVAHPSGSRNRLLRHAAAPARPSEPHAATTKLP